MTLNGGACPSLETIGAFVDGRFTGRERDVVADHLASCEACYFVFVESSRLRAAAPTTTVIPFQRRRSTWRIAAGLAAAATLVLSVNLYNARRGADDAALSELVAAVGTTRTFDARLSGGFAYAPLRLVRSGESVTATLSPDARIIVARIEKDTASPSTAHAHGLATLIGGDVDRAIAALDEAARARVDARLLNDLAAAYLVRAEQRNSAQDNSHALAAANRALELERLLPEALFNRALALDRLGLEGDAADAWRAFLTIDDRSGWADEARARLRILSDHP
jgi:tetratricopeptide (TPR) repeat protein